MAIQRDSSIRFHELGTLTSVTRWIITHDQGIAEWLKNARRAYQPDRANVDEKHRTALLLLRDGEGGAQARIGVLDVGGATLEDITAWSTWQDPEASNRGSGLSEEETQGNGGKAYMYKLFGGPARILGVREKKLNCKGFEGPSDSLERGTPGYVPDAACGCNLPIVAWESELTKALVPYDLILEELPAEVREAIRAREAFTLVEGVDPLGLFKGRIDADDLVQKVLRHDQSALAVQQLRLYAVHNNQRINGGRALCLEPIAPYPGFEQPAVYEIPEELQDANGNTQSTTLGGERPRGRLILYTSRENMPNAYKKLKPRWRVTYRTSQQMIGSKQVSELVPTTPGSQHVYATVELSALEPDYVELGRKRPNEGPLVEALDNFISEKIRSLAKLINDRARHEQDEEALDEVYEENRLLNNFKNRFLPSGGIGGDGGPGEDGKGPRKRTRITRPGEYGVVPDSIELDWDPNEKLRVGRAVSLPIGPILKPRVLDTSGKLVPHAEIEWCTTDRHVVRFGDQGVMLAAGRGLTEIWARVKGRGVESDKILTEVWVVDHVLLTPRSLEIPLGRRKQIIAEVTSDEGSRATDVYLNWKHDADDQLIVRIQPIGWVTGNRLGRTTITAGAGDPAEGGVWARIVAEVTVVPNPDKLEHGGGFPSLLLTDRDIDPASGEIRPGDPEEPALWQEVSDDLNNIWWLNLQSPDAAYFFAQRDDDIRLWRSFHAQKVVDMVIQVHMKDEFTAKGDAERPDLWVRHKAMVDLKEVQLKEAMWDKLKEYVSTGGGLE